MTMFIKPVRKRVNRRKVKSNIWRIVIHVDIGDRSIIDVEKVLSDTLVRYGTFPVMFAERSRRKEGIK